jgi:hypothetical protein
MIFPHLHVVVFSVVTCDLCSCVPIFWREEHTASTLKVST